MGTTSKTPLYHNIHRTFTQCCVALCEHCCSTLKSGQTTLFRQYFVNVPNIKIQPNYNIQATLWQAANQRTRVHTMLYQHWVNMSFSTWHQCCYNVGGTHQESEILKMKNMDSKTVLECVSDMQSLHSELCAFTEKISWKFIFCPLTQLLW